MIKALFIAAYTLKEFNVVTLDVDSWHYFYMIICSFYLLSVLLVIVMFVLKLW